MKKYLFVAIVAISTLLNAHADESGDVTIAPQIAFATKHTTAGIGVQAQYYALDNLRVAPEFIFYFKNDNITAYNGNLNVHYLIPKGTALNIYPLAGFSYARYKINLIDDEGEKYDEKHDRIGLNIGAGAEYQIQEMLHLFAEERFQIMKDFNQSVTVVGVRLSF